MMRHMMKHDLSAGAKRHKDLSAEKLRATVNDLYNASVCLAAWEGAPTTFPRLIELLQPIVDIKIAILFNELSSRPPSLWTSDEIDQTGLDRAWKRAEKEYRYFNGKFSANQFDEFDDLEENSPEAEEDDAQRLCVEDCTDSYNPSNTHFRQNCLSIPLAVVSNPKIGFLYLCCESLSPTSVTLLHAIGSQLAVALDREYRLEQYEMLQHRIQQEQLAAKEREAKKIRDKRFRLLAESLPQIVWAARPDGRAIYLNEQWFEFSGLSRDCIEGHKLLDAVHPDDRTTLVNTWFEANEKKSSFSIEARLCNGTGAFKWHLHSGIPEFDERGLVSRWVGISVDIEQQKQHEANILKAKEEAEASSKLKNSFIANVSHEIRTPLSIILGYTELALDDAENAEDCRESLQIVIRNGRLLGRMVDELLDLSKIEAGYLQIETRPVELRELMEEIVQPLRFKANEKGLDLTLNCADEVPTTCSTDAYRLKQCLINIISNAIKFTEQGLVALEVKARPSDNDGTPGFCLDFFVRDTGIGLSPEQQGKVFQPFTQADVSTTRRFGGTGLGLTLSKNLAKALGGDLQVVESELGRGSTFLLSIWSEAVQQEDRLNDHSHSLGQDFDVRPLEITEDLHGLDVLVVDDINENRVLVKSLLEKAGARVEVSSNGAEGVDKALRGCPDMVIMDIQMPGISGLDAAARLRQQGFDRPMIALTADAMLDCRQESLEAGFDDFLAKPINQQLLFNTIHHVCKKSRPPVRLMH